MDEFVTVGSFTSLIEANAIQGRLEVAGLNARTRAEYTASLIPSLSNVRVEVPRELSLLSSARLHRRADGSARGLERVGSAGLKT